MNLRTIVVNFLVFASSVITQNGVSSDVTVAQYAPRSAHAVPAKAQRLPPI